MGSCRRLHLHLDTIRYDFGALDATPGMNGNALFFERFLQRCSDFAVFHGQNLWQHLDERDLTPKSVIEIRKLYSNGSCADDHQRLWHLLQQHGLRAAQHVGLIERQPWQGTWASAGGEDHMGGMQRGTGSPLSIMYGDNTSASQTACPTQDVNFIFPHQKRHP